MNIHPHPTESPLAPPQWSMALAFEGVGSSYQCTGTISRRCDVMCRMSVMNDAGECEAVRSQLAERARAWIAEFQERGATSVT